MSFLRGPLVALLVAVVHVVALGVDLIFTVRSLRAPRDGERPRHANDVGRLVITLLSLVIAVAHLILLFH